MPRCCGNTGRNTRNTIAILVSGVSVELEKKNHMWEHIIIDFSFLLYTSTKNTRKKTSDYSDVYHCIGDIALRIHILEQTKILQVGCV